MKRVENINLGGKKFTIDQDAYHELDDYLQSIRGRFSNSNGVDDILYDIETRLSELFEENKQGSDIITIEKVKKVKSIMGMPSDFESEVGGSAHTSNDNYSTEKRLFRNNEDKVVAGICSGLAAYWGLESPILTRILFVMLAFSGIGVIPYIVLWIFVPEAKTTSDKLTMHGEKINIDTIAKSVEEGITDIKDTLEDLGKNIKNKMH